MAKTVAAVMLNVTRSVYGLDIDNRDTEFGQMVTQGVAAAKNGVAAPDLIVFIAPEYFFSRFNEYGLKLDGTKSDIAPVTRKEKWVFYDAIVAASKANPSVLIVGGTIFYSKTSGIINKQKTGLNVCPIAFGGKIKHKIYKRDDDLNASFYDQDATFKQKSGKSDPIFTEAGVAFSVDICADNGRARDFAKSAGISDVDIHIMVSAGRTPSQSPVAKHILHCDLTGSGQSGAGGVTTLQTGAAKKVAAVSTSAAQVNGVQYVVYDLTV